MSANSLCLAVLAALGAAAPPARVTGTFTGLSGKPMAGAHLMLGKIVGERDVIYAWLKLLPHTETVADAHGRFQWKGVTPGKYVVVYQPAGHSGVFPLEFGIKSLVAVTPSIMPLLKGVEIGRGDGYPNRAWGGAFTLLKGHTFVSEGQYMRVFNATVRRNPGGPYIEMRDGMIRTEDLPGKGELKLDAWSF